MQRQRRRRSQFSFRDQVVKTRLREFRAFRRRCWLAALIIAAKSSARREIFFFVFSGCTRLDLLTVRLASSRLAQPQPSFHAFFTLCAVPSLLDSQTLAWPAVRKRCQSKMDAASVLQCMTTERGSKTIVANGIGCSGSSSLGKLPELILLCFHWLFAILLAWRLPVATIRSSFF